MAFDSIGKIEEAEKEAKDIIAAARADADVLIESAAARNSEKFKFSLDNAEIEAKNIAARAQAEVKDLSQKQRDDTANKCAVMTVRAEKKYADAIEYIIGKAVV